MAKRIVWTESAKKDKIEILSYWNVKTKSKRYSKKLNDIFNSHAEIILQYPFLGKQSEYESIRCLPFGNYSLYYQIEPKRIIIHRIWDNRQKTNHKNYGFKRYH